jgi:hypothetical protein
VNQTVSTADLDSWIDMDGADFKRLENQYWIRKAIHVGLETGQVKVDNAGYLWKDSSPVYAKLDGKLVGLRYSAKAVN